MLPGYHICPLNLPGSSHLFFSFRCPFEHLPLTVMTVTAQVYSVEDEISQFFEKTTATRAECDAKAQELVGGPVVHIAIQGACSYSVYAGPDLEYVVQFRLKSLELSMDISDLARRVFGQYAPEVTFKGQLGPDGDESQGKEPLLIYVMSRIRGITHLDFLLSHDIPKNSSEYFELRKNLITDVAKYVSRSSRIGFTADLCMFRFFAICWKSPQQVDTAFRNRLEERLRRELNLLLSIPDRFHPTIHSLVESLPAILSLPMVLLHKDFGSCNILVDENSFHLIGVVDWAEAEIGPFGMNLHSLATFSTELHLKNGVTKYEDHESLQDLFWDTFRRDVGGLSDDTVETIKAARVLGQLLSRGFTSRLADMPEPVPLNDDESGRYNLLILDGMLINQATRFI